MKLVWLTTILIVVLVLVMPAGLALSIKKIPSGFQTSLSDTENLYGDMIITQSFTASDNNLSAIGLTVKNPYLKNKQNLNFTLSSETRESRTLVINGANIYDGDFVYFSFDPIPNSKDKNIVFNFQSPTTTTQDSFELYHTADKSSGSFMVNGLEKPGQLAFVSYYKPTNIFSIWGTIYGQWLGKLFQDLPFALFYSFLILGFGGYLIKVHTSKKTN